MVYWLSLELEIGLTIPWNEVSLQVLEGAKSKAYCW